MDSSGSYLLLGKQQEAGQTKAVPEYQQALETILVNVVFSLPFHHHSEHQKKEQNAEYKDQNRTPAMAGKRE
jgi:hypothetical protein